MYRHAFRHLRRVVALLTLSIAATVVPVKAQINTDQVMRIGQNALYFEDYMVAIQYFNQVIGAKPWLAMPYFYRAVAKINLDDYSGAEADASIAIEKNPFISGAYEVRGVARQNLGFTREAIADYNHLLAERPDNRNILFNKALAEEDIKDYDAATESFNKLISRYPRYDGGYIARSRHLLALNDTASALADINRAIELNPNTVNPYLMRAEILINNTQEYDKALPDLDMAIKLQPRNAGLYINRAYIRYRTDDYRGAMADFDYAISLEPLNTTALYNRGLLRAEIHDYNNSIDDFTKVLDMVPDHHRARFNRANLYREVSDWNNAYKDIDLVVKAFPTFAAAYYLRGEIQYNRGNQRAADADFKKSVALARHRVEMLPDSDLGNTSASTEANDSTGIFGESQEEVAKRFSSLIKVDNMQLTTESSQLKGSSRGQIQNTDFTIQLEPIYSLSFYSEPTELKMSTDFVREVDALNRSGMLNQTLYVVCHDSSRSEGVDFGKHYESVKYYDSWISTHTPRPVDYFARAMDLMTIHNYEAAISDLDRAIEMSADFTIAYLARSIARWKSIEASSIDTDSGKDAAIVHNARVNAVLDDLDQVLALSPNMAVAWYNKGVVLAGQSDYSGAIHAFDRAIECMPEMGEAWFNRGYSHMMLGNKKEAFTDLSRAGELGIIPSYNLIKRMAR